MQTLPDRAAADTYGPLCIAVATDCEAVHARASSFTCRRRRQFIAADDGVYFRVVPVFVLLPSVVVPNLCSFLHVTHHGVTRRKQAFPPFPCSEACRVPGAGHLPLLMTGPPQAGGRGRGPLRVPAEAGGVYGVARLSPPPQPARLLNQPACIPAGLRSGLHWMKRSGDDPVGCWC